MNRAGFAFAACAALVACTGGEAAGPLRGQTFLLDLTSGSGYGSGYGEFMLPTLVGELTRAGLRPASGPGADVAVNIQVSSDKGQWVGQGYQRQWLHNLSVLVGFSPEEFVIEQGGKPAFGVEARMTTPDADRVDEIKCLTALAARTALAEYQPTGKRVVDGASCARK